MKQNFSWFRSNAGKQAEDTSFLQRPLLRQGDTAKYIEELYYYSDCFITLTAGFAKTVDDLNF